MILVYIACPYTHPDPAANVNRAIHVANCVWDLGIVPLVPVLSHLWHLITPKPYDEWMSMDMELLSRCDALLRVEGESCGADKELHFAILRRMPVFYTIDEIREWQVNEQL